MSVGLLLITHDGLGKVFHEAVKAIINDSPVAIEVIDACRDCDPDMVFEEAQKRLARLDSGQGVLVLTDLYGSTPSNVASRLFVQDRINVITGLNLPMLIRILNYPDKDLKELTEKALEAGKEGVMAIGK